MLISCYNSYRVGQYPTLTQNIKKGVVLMTLRELLKQLNLSLDGYDALKDLQVINVDNFCLFALLEYLSKEEFQKDLVILSADLDEADQLGRTPKLYFQHRFRGEDFALCLKLL